MATAKMPVRLKGHRTCEHHKAKRLKFYCEQCQEPVCSKCVTSLHKGHLFCDLSEITPQKKEKIRNFIDKTEQNVFLDIGDYIASANTLLTENDRTFEIFSKDLKAQTKRLKQDLDTLTAETLSLFQKKKDDNTKLIQKYKQDLEMYEKQLKHQMQECKKTLQQGSHIDIYYAECEIDSQLHLPVKPVLGTVSFTPNKTPRNHLELALGTCKSDDPGQTSTLKVKDRPVALSYGQPYKQQSPSCSRKNAVTRTKLLTTTKVLEEWKSPCDISSICPITDDQAWTCDGSETLTLIDRNGKVIQKVEHRAWINDISLSPTTHRLWAYDTRNNIVELVSGEFSERIRTKDEPRCICVTADNHIIVGMSKHITKYTTQGQIVLTTEVTGTTTPLLCTPYGITECPITKNVAVIDRSYGGDGGNGDKHVVVMDTDFRELFMYRGSIPRRFTVTPRKGNKPFDPWGIVYDSQGNIIISDWTNDKIHILNGDCRLPRILDMDRVWAIGVSRQGDLWTVSIFNNVKLLKYYE